MSLFDRRSFLFTSLAALGGLSACGFTPAYGPGGSAAALRGRVTLPEAADRNGYDLNRHLAAVFGPATAPTYSLDYKLAVNENPVGVTRDQEITRYHVEGTLQYSLTDMARGAVVASGTVTQFTAYSATGSTVDALTAPRDARARLMRILGDDMVSRLIANPELGR